MESRRTLDVPAARVARFAALAVAGLSLGAVVLYFVVPLFGRAFVGGVQLVINACVWMATSVGAGISAWDVLTTVGRAAIRSLVTPVGSLTLSILVVVGIMALYWLQRLLESESEEESSQ